MISVTDLKFHLNLPTSFTTHDDYLDALEEAAVSYVERVTGRYFGAAGARTEYLSGTGIDTLWLADIPTTITSVTERDSLTDAGTELVEDTDYVVRGNRLVYVSNTWDADYEYEVVYTAGYAAGAEPADVRQAVKMLVGHWYTNRLPVVTAQTATEVPVSVREILPSNPVIA